jgi:hypothetical protein
VTRVSAGSPAWRPRGVVAFAVAAVAFAVASVLALAAARRPIPPAPALALRLEPGIGETQVLLLAPPGVRINARLKPAFELTDGRLLRFDGAPLTPDSAYFAAPPVTTLPGRQTSVHGTLRASVCGKDERVCRTVSIAL